jgi:hypothetical protein
MVMTVRCLVRLAAYVATVFSSLLCNNPVAGQAVVLESAVLGATGRIGGTSVTVSQFVGWRFETSERLAVERVGGHLLSFPDQPGQIFAALVRLQSIDSVPLGAAFTAQEVVATTTFRPPFPSDEVLAPLAATLTPGSYTLVFGTGLFGATGAGALHIGDDQPDIPPTDISSFIFWSIPSFGQPFEWRLNLASHMRFVIDAQVINIPSDYNNNGIVDAADYSVWRDTLGSISNLAADGNANGVIDDGDYDVWKSNFGNHSGAGAGVNAAVPEPASCVLLLAGTLALLSRRRARGHNLGRFVGRANMPVCRERRRFSVGANPTRPIRRSAGSNSGDEGPDSESQNSLTRDTGQQPTHLETASR